MMSSNQHQGTLMQDQLPPDSGQHAELIRELTPLALMALAATVRFMMLPTNQSAWTYIRGLCAAVLVGFMVNSLVDGYELAEGYRIACIAVGAFLADDILRGLLTLGEKFTRDPLGFIRGWFGGKK